jgi:hypothetical protein
MKSLDSCHHGRATLKEGTARLVATGIRIDLMLLTNLSRPGTNNR